MFFVPGAHLDVAVLQDWHSLDHQRGAAAAKRRCELEVSGVDSGVNRIAIRVSPTVSISNIYVPIIEFSAIYIGSGAPALSAKEVPEFSTSREDPGGPQCRQCRMVTALGPTPE